MEVFFANTQLAFPLLSCAIDCRSLNRKTEAMWITKPSHGEQLSWSLVQDYTGLWGGSKLSNVYPPECLSGFYLGITWPVLTDAYIVTRNGVISYSQKYGNNFVW